AEQQSEERDDQNGPGADDDPGEHVTAELISAEPVRAGRGLVRREQLLGERVLRRDHVPQHRADHPEQQDRGTSDERGPAQQQPPRRQFAAPAGDRDLGGRSRDDLGHSAPPRRSRGLSTVYSKSAMSVATMNTTPTVSTPAASIGKSLELAALMMRFPIPWELKSVSM